jgi:hypothetical protein
LLPLNSDPAGRANGDLAHIAALNAEFNSQVLRHVHEIERKARRDVKLVWGNGNMQAAMCAAKARNETPIRVPRGAILKKECPFLRISAIVTDRFG